MCWSRASQAVRETPENDSREGQRLEKENKEQRTKFGKKKKEKSCSKDDTQPVMKPGYLIEATVLEHSTRSGRIGPYSDAGFKPNLSNSPCISLQELQKGLKLHLPWYSK